MTRRLTTIDAAEASEDLAAGTVDGDLTISGNLQVDGTTTTVNSTTVSVDDKNIELGATDSPTDSTADGGGITLKGSTDKTISWENDDNRWHFNQGLDLDGDIYFSPSSISTAHIQVPSGSLDIRCANSLKVGTDGADSVRIGRTNTTAAKVYLRSGNDDDLVVSNGKIGIGTDSPAHELDVDGDVHVSGEVKTANIGYTDGDNAITIADGGACTFAAGITSTASGNTFGTTTLGATTADSLSVDNISINGTEIDLSSGDLTIDVAGDIKLDAGGADVEFLNAGTEFGLIGADGSNNMVIEATIADKDILFKGTDGSSEITALTLDISEAGNASFNADVNVGGEVQTAKVAYTDGDDAITIADGGACTFAAGITSNAASNTFGTTTLGTTTAGALTADSLAVDNISINGTEIDLSSGDLTIDVAGDIKLDAGGADVEFLNAGTEFGLIGADGSNNMVIESTIQDKNILFKGDDNGSEITALTLDMSAAGDATFNHDVKVTGDILLDDGGSLKEAGGTAAIPLDGSGEVTKIGQDSPSNNQVLTWDNGNSKVVWADAGGSGAVASVSNGSNNRIATFTSSDDLNGEANLEFDGTDLSIAAAGKLEFRDTGIHISSDEDGHLQITADAHVTTSGFPSNENAIGTSATSIPSVFGADGDCTGDIIKLLNDTTTKGHIYYLADDPAWEEAQANDTNDGGPGDMLAMAVGTNSNTHGMLVKGFMRIDSGNYNGTAGIGKIGYLSDDTAGQIDFTAPAGSGEVVRVVGHCLQKDGSNHILFYFNPSNDYVEIA